MGVIDLNKLRVRGNTERKVADSKISALYFLA